MVNYSLIGTVSQGTTSFDDPDYIYTGYSITKLYYDVRAYCTTFDGESAPNFQGIYLGELYKGNGTALTNQHFDNSIGNYPNPFNPTTQIRYSVAQGGLVTLCIYDVLGNKVAELVNEYKPAGNYLVNFDGSSQPSGIYFCTIKAANYTASRKMLLIK